MRRATVLVLAHVLISGVFCDAAAAAPAAPDPNVEGDAAPEAASEAGHHALHPPVGIGAGHTLHKRGFAIGYTFQHRRYEGLRDGEDSLDAQDVQSYSRAPSSLDVQEHEISLMYAPAERLTLMATLPVFRKEMREVALSVPGPAPLAAAGRTLRSEGVGDLRLTAIARFMERGNEVLFFGSEIGAPTGSIRERTAAGERLPYPMQLGSGSWHAQTGLTYQGHTWKYTWGGQVTTLFRLNENELGYKLGNRYEVSGWLARSWLDWLSSSLRLEWHKWGNTHGADSGLSVLSSPVADSKRQAGERLDLGAGLDLHVPFLARQTLAVEAVWPLLQDLDGPQPDEEWRVRAGWRWAF